MAKKINIEVRYVDRDTCSRCKKTGENTEKTYRKLKSELEKLGVGVSFKTRKLPLSKLKQSNSVFINGKDLGVLLKEEGGLSVGQSTCYGCSKIMRKPCACRTYTHKGKRYRYITESMIKEAVMKILRDRIQKMKVRIKILKK